jgi:hypothetical protein
LSVGAVVVDAGVVDVVVVDEVAAPEFPAVDVVVEPPPDPFDGVEVVVVVWADGLAGATKGMVSPVIVARVLEGVTVKLVQPRAAFQLWLAAAAGCPVSGWGSPASMVAGRKTAFVM